MDKKTKRENFEKKAYKRVGKIIHSINILPCFANREFYNYSALEIMSLFSEMEKALSEAREKYINELQKEEGEYILMVDEDDYDQD